MLKRQPPETPLVFHLSAVSAYSTFGGLLHAMRNHHNSSYHENVSPKKITDATNRLLKAKGQKLLSSRAYSDLETGRRYPRFVELEPLFRALVETFAITFSDLEITAYVHLAREKLSEKQKQKDEVGEREWQLLETTLFRIHNSKPGRVRLVMQRTEAQESAEASGLVEDEQSRRLQALSAALDLDLRHLLEREEWTERMLTYATLGSQVKLVVIQGAMGVGKSHAAALLMQRLTEHNPRAYLIPYLFRSGEGKTPESQLDEFLATMMADLVGNSSDDTKQPVHERVKQVLTEIKKREDQEQKVILLLDDTHLAFGAATELPPAWAELFEMFVRMPHNATMYLFTRVWAGIDERHLAFVEQDEMPNLSASASMTLWQRRGFSDVPESLLEAICERCGQNPYLMDMMIAQCKKHSFALSRWGKSGATTSCTGKKNANTEYIETLLAADTLFDLTLDVRSRAVLQQALTSSLNHQARQMLECLSLSPLGLPFPLLLEEFARAEVALSELKSVSTLDLKLMAAHRAAVTPFVREAVTQALQDEGRKEGIEARVTDLYTYWLTTLQDFRDDHEKTALIAEMIVRFIRTRQLLKAAEIIIEFGWLCMLFGQMSRIQRVFDEVVRANRSQDMGDAYEAGRVLLSYHLMMTFGEKINLRERDKDFHMVRDLCLAGKIVLQPQTEISIAHYLTLKMIHEKRYQYACDFLDKTFHRISVREEVMPEDRASYLHSKSNVLGEWSSALKTDQPAEAKRLYSESVEILTEVMRIWRLCLSHSLPVQEHRYQFRIAKALNDLACYLRMLNRLEEAEQAIIDCLDLKENKKASSPSSLAISYGEQAQILAAKGQFKNAEIKSDEAIQRIDTFIRSGGDPFAIGNKGTLLFERAQIYEVQGRLDEAYQLAQEALTLLDENRASYRLEADQLCQRVQCIQESSLRYHLDSEWYKEYRTLAQYDAISRLSQAGPFSSEEQRLWDNLFSQYRDVSVWKQLASIIRQSRDREFEQSVSEGRLPVLWYPAIDIDDICARMRDFSSLKERIEQQEKNAIVRRLYVRKIEEDLLNLRLISYTHSQDVEGVRACYETLYGRISQSEMTIALRELFSMLTRALKHPLASEAAQFCLTQLKQWNLSAAEFLPSEEIPAKKGNPAKIQMWSETRVSPHAVQRFYEEVIQKYGFDEWRVVLSADRDTPSPDPDLCILYLPTSQDSTVLSVAELLTEEVETHMLRSAAGKQSRLALLGSGTSGYLPTEEGLAIYAVTEMWEAQGLGHKTQTWLETLVPGLAAGILTPAHSFEALYAFLSKVLLAGQLFSSGRYKTVESAKGVVQRMTFRKVMRAFRGVPDLTVAGVCNAKDRVYLQGYREVTAALAKHSQERLYVGSIGIADLADMEDLRISQPTIQKLNLACDPNLFEQITSL